MNQEQEHEWSIDRRRCLVRHLLQLRRERGKEAFERYVSGWKQWESVKAAYWEQLQRGNRGEPGDWRE
jgi:hypothetical protein